MKRKFRKLKDIGVVVAIFTSSRIWSSPKVTAGSYSLVVLRLARHSMMALAKVIPMVSDIRPRLPPASLDDIRDRDTQLSHRGTKVSNTPRVYFSRSEEHTSELQSLLRTSYAVISLKKK